MRVARTRSPRRSETPKHFQREDCFAPAADARVTIEGKPEKFSGPKEGDRLILLCTVRPRRLVCAAGRSKGRLGLVTEGSPSRG
jgi:hypothetical protein